jgi:uncharacterized membrane protein YesL
MAFFFSVLLGFGVTGLFPSTFAVRRVLAGSGGCRSHSSERLIISQLWSVFSKPASTLAFAIESVLEDEARAVSGFDKGCGPDFRRI